MAIYTKPGDKGETGISGGRRVSKGDIQISVIGTVDELNSSLGLAVAMMESVRQFRSFPDAIRNGAGKVSKFQEIDIGLARLIGQLRDVQRELFEMGAELAKLNIKNQKSNIHIKNQKIGREGSGDLIRMAEEFVNKREGVEQAKLGEEREPEAKKVNEEVTRFDAKKLEVMIDEMEGDLPRLENFILPGGGVVGAQLMLARAVCRRTEREFVRFLNLKRKVKSSKRNHKTYNMETSKLRNLETILAYLNRLSDYLFVASRWVNWLMEEEEFVWKRNI